MFHVHQQESNVAIPGKCLVPVHFLTRGFNAKHQYEARSVSHQARTVFCLWNVCTAPTRAYPRSRATSLHRRATSLHRHRYTVGISCVFLVGVCA